MSDIAESPNSPSRSSTTSPYRWPVVTTFQDWEFPETMHDIFSRCARFQTPAYEISAQSNLTSAIRQRDIRCRVTAFQDGTEVAHLVPEHEKHWFLLNSMSRWNSDLTLDPENLLRDHSNAVLLRSDVHAAFDQRKFFFFPKAPGIFSVHMLEPTTHIGQLYHNTIVDLKQCTLEFIFARVAWSIFPSLSAWTAKMGTARRIIRCVPETGVRIVEEVTNTEFLARRATASRSTSPTKRKRANAENAEETEEFGYTKRRLYSSSLPSLISTPTNEQLHEMPAASEHKGDGESMTLKDSRMRREDELLEQLRIAALHRQRPRGFVSDRPPYVKNRPAREELLLMGVEVWEDLTDEE